MKVNGKTIKGIGYAFDRCHKIYILADLAEWKQAKEYGFECWALKTLPKVWEYTCPLRFISTWSLTDYYVEQGENAVFEM